MPVACAVEGVDLRLLAWWHCRFESRRGHGCLSVVNVMCCLCDRPIPRTEETHRVCVCVSLSAIVTLYTYNAWVEEIRLRKKKGKKEGRKKV